MDKPTRRSRRWKRHARTRVARRPVAERHANPSRTAPDHALMEAYAKLAIEMTGLPDTIEMTRLALVGAAHELATCGAPVEEAEHFVEPVRDALEDLHLKSVDFSERSMKIGAELHRLIGTRTPRRTAQ
jgi:hypothetical protein